MSATEIRIRPLSHWPTDADVAYVLEDDTSLVELVVTTDGRAIVDGHELRIKDHVRVAEQRAGRAAVHAGRI